MSMLSYSSTLRQRHVQNQQSGWVETTDAPLFSNDSTTVSAPSNGNANLVAGSAAIQSFLGNMFARAISFLSSLKTPVLAAITPLQNATAQICPSLLLSKQKEDTSSDEAIAKALSEEYETNEVDTSNDEAIAKALSEDYSI